MPRYIPSLVMLSLLMVSQFAYGEETREPWSEMVASGVLMLPRGEWKSARQPLAGGGAFHALFPVETSRASAGVDVQALFYESQSNTEQLITAQGLLRIQLSDHPRRAFVETFGGLKGFSVEPNRPGYFTYGVGGGMQFPVTTRPPFTANDHEYIEIGVRYLRGGGNSIIVFIGWGLRLGRAPLTHGFSDS